MRSTRGEFPRRGICRFKKYETIVLERKPTPSTRRDLEAKIKQYELDLAKLENTEAEYQASFEGAAVGKILADPFTRRVIRVNPAFANMLGYRPEALVGQSTEMFTLDKDLEEDRTEHAKLLSGVARVYVREKRYVRSDNTIFWVRATARIAKHPVTGASFLLVGTVEDVDQKHAADEALLSAKRDLEEVVEDRTKALEERALLLREVYHRVKNNLQIIDGIITLQARRICDLAARNALLSVRHRLHALSLVHQQLMGASDLRTFNIAPFLSELVDNLSGGQEKQIDVVVRSIPLYVDLDFALPTGLIVTELVTNSLKHGFKGDCGKIIVELDVASNGHVTLNVSDNGDMTAGRAIPSPDRQGLGWSIIAGLVRQLSGTMDVEIDNGWKTSITLQMQARDETAE
jgi:PAS domain S-box-containing protein